MIFKEHFRKHGAVHAVWTISILSLIIMVLLFRNPSSDRLGTIIGFAASAVSLVLALIAIGYSFISNQTFSELIGSLRSSAERAEGSSRNLGEVSSSLVSLAERISGEIAGLTPRFDAIDSKIDSRLSTNKILPAPPAGKDEQTLARGSTLTPALAAALYAVLRMHQTGKVFNTSVVFADEKWKQYVGGCLAVISYLRPLGINLERKGGFEYKLVSLGAIEEDVLSSYFELDKVPPRKRGDIEKYFDGLPEHGPKH